MKNIIITGGLGFIGSNFINKIIDKNYSILNIDSLSYSSNIPLNQKFKKFDNYRFLKSSIGNLKIKKIIKNFNPHYIVNFAAESHVDRSIDNPLSFVKNNVNDLLNFLEIVRSLKKDIQLKKFIHISTDEVYGELTNNDKPFNEMSPYLPNSPYSASKASGDHLVRAWSKTFSMPMIITHCTNNYGPFQFPEKLIPLTINKLMNKQSIPIYGDGSNIRDWIHVDDHNDAILKLLLRGKVDNTYNISANNELTNLVLIKNICKIFRIISDNNFNYLDLITFVTDRPAHDFRYSLSSKKICKEIKWKSKINFDSGLKSTIIWYMKNYKWTRSMLKNKYNLERLGLIK